MVQELCDKELEIHHHNQIRIIIFYDGVGKKATSSKRIPEADY